MTNIIRFVERRPAFDPEELAVLIEAYENAWCLLEESRNECTRPAYARAMREVVARRILEVARRGVIEVEQLAAQAANFLATNYFHETKNGPLSPVDCSPANQETRNAERGQLATAALIPAASSLAIS
jgi:hypothetical protein